MELLTKRPRTRLSPEKRKQQLLEIAIEVFAKRGIGRGGHADIADMAQVSVATVFNYFPTREDLVDQVLSNVERQFADFIEQSLQQGLPVKQNLLNISNNLVDVVLSGSHWIRVWFEWSTSTREEVWPRFVSTHSQHQQRFHALFSAAIEAGELNDKHHPSDIAKLFHGICYSLFIQVNRNQDSDYLEQLTHSFLDMLCIYRR